MPTFLTPSYDVRLIAERNSHFYDVYFGEKKVARFPGVTGTLGIIAKPALIQWAKTEALSNVERALTTRLDGRVRRTLRIDKEWISALLIESAKRPEKIRDDAADLGTRIHAIIDQIVLGKTLEEIPPELGPAIEAFRAWLEESEVEFVAGDTKVASLIHKYGGSLDALGRRHGQYVLYDWKSSKGTYKEMALQVAAYNQALFETYGVRCEEAVVVRFGKKLPIEFEPKKVRDLAHSLEAFLAAKKLKDSLDLEHFE